MCIGLCDLGSEASKIFFVLERLDPLSPSVVDSLLGLGDPQVQPGPSAKGCT